MRFTRKDLDKKVRQGMIRSYEEKVKIKKVKNKLNRVQVCIHKFWINASLTEWCRFNQMTLQLEYRFHPTRMWRADWVIKELKIIIEYEGIMSRKSRHTTATGYTGDREKYNAAQLLGYTVLGYTVMNYKNVIQDLDEKLKTKAEE